MNTKVNKNEHERKEKKIICMKWLIVLQYQGAFTGGQILFDWFNELLMSDRDLFLGARECFLGVRGKCERMVRPNKNYGKKARKKNAQVVQLLLQFAMCCQLVMGKPTATLGPLNIAKLQISQFLPVQQMIKEIWIGSIFA